jgi:PEP-CTERM motif
MLSFFKKFKYLLVVAVFFLLFPPTTSKAFTITAVTAPNLTRPSDGVLYPFNITVSGTYTAADLIIAGVKDTLSVTAEYWDQDRFIFDFLDPDDPIDLNGSLVIPLIGAVVGAAWGPVTVAFEVGCKTSPEIFGPSGPTGENPMDDGYFKFTTGAGLTLVNYGSWGYNTVTCNTAPPVPINPPTPYPGMKPIPEPSSLMLLGIGIFGLLAYGCRRGEKYW